MAYTVVPSVIDGDDLTDDFTLSVKDAVDELQEANIAVDFTPVGNTDGDTSGLGNNWITLTSSLSVPAWATSAIITMCVTGVHSITAASSYLLISKIGGTTGTGAGFIAWGATGDRRGVTWVTALSGFSTGTNTLVVHATRTAGTGQARADTTSRLSASIVWGG
jgi:hypothetical protein